MQSDEIKKIINIKQILREGLVVYRNNLNLFIPIGLIYGFSAVTDTILLEFFNFKSPLAVFIISVLVSCWASIALIYAAAQIFNKQEIGLNEALIKPMSKYLLYVAVSLAFMGIEFAGFILFILPGIYFGTIFGLADMIVVLEKTNFVGAFKRSVYLVENYFWPVLFYMLIVISIMLVPSFIIQGIADKIPNLARPINVFILVITVPIIMISQVGLYYCLKGIKDGNEILINQNLS